MMFLTVYLSNNDHHFSEVPVTPETLCRDVLELCREPGEAHCYLAEMWRGSERVVEEEERMLEVLQRWGQQRGEVRYLLRHQKVLRQDSGSRGSDEMMKMNLVQVHMDQRLDNEEQQLHYLKLQSQEQQQDLSELEHLQQLRQNALNQESRLQQVQALRNQVEQKRLSNGKMVDEIAHLTSLFQQKQRELLEGVTRVEQLSDQLECFRRSRLELSCLPHRHNKSSTIYLEHLYKELQLRNKLNQKQSVRLQQQRDSLSKSNLRVASMERRLAELRQRLWSKKAALQQIENLPLASDSAAPQHDIGSKVAAVGPYIKSSSTSHCQGPPVPSRQGAPVKPAYTDDSAMLPIKPPARPAKPASGFNTSKITTTSNWSNPPPDSTHASTLPRMSRLRCQGSGGEMSTCLEEFSASVLPPVPTRTNHSTENLPRDTQAAGKRLPPPPLPCKLKPFFSSHLSFSKPPYNTRTLPYEAKGVRSYSSYSSTLPLPRKQEIPPATVQLNVPARSDGPLPVLYKPQTLAAKCIYSMYTNQSTPGQSPPLGVQGSVHCGQIPVYGKPVVPSSKGQQPSGSDQLVLNSDISTADRSYQCNSESERDTPRPLSPTKLLPFQFSPHRNLGDADLDALRRRLHKAPRPLKKRNSITECDGAAGPNIQKLIYQKTTLAAMETIPIESTPKFLHPVIPENMMGGGTVPSRTDDKLGVHQLPGTPQDTLIPPLPDLARSHSMPPSKEDPDQEKVCPSSFVQDYSTEDFPPPPDPDSMEVGLEEDSEILRPLEVTGQMPGPKKSILRKTSSKQIGRSLRVKFNPLALLLDSSLEGEYDLVQKVIYDVENPSMPNDEGITALHNAVCAGHTEIVKFLVQFGVNVNAVDSDGWTPLHCAASCNNVQVCKFLVESGAAVFATTYSDMQTAADKCEEMEEGYAQCSQFLYGVQEKMGVMNRGVVYALWDYQLQREDELGFSQGDCITVLRRDDETEWWWACCGDSQGYVPRNLLGLYLRIKQRQRSLA